MVEHPQMRESVIDVLRVFSDPDYQRRMWVEERDVNPQVIENLDENISVLYDLSDVAENPYEHIGITLVDEREAQAVEKLNRVLSPLIDSLPPGTDDAAVIGMPEWQEVVAMAQKAYRTFMSTPEPH